MSSIGPAPSARAQTAGERSNDPAQVWHEGSRIRRGDSTGYADSVPDETIWQHLVEDVAQRDVDAVTFRASVLRLRVALADPERHVCPECEQGKHANCDGTAWDDAKDEPTSCTCRLHEGVS